MITSRREFLGWTAASGASLTLSEQAAAAASDAPLDPPQAPESDWNRPLDLSPAKWIWYPSERTLQNTCILFRKTFDLADVPSECSGWMLAESRYKLFVNGHYVQFGPAPSDPRYSECDPLARIQPYLKAGRNVIAVQAMYFGVGDGTWPMGKPGLIFRLDAGGRTIVSDKSWTSTIARAWPPGQYKRWYLRALQEERDNRLVPTGWAGAAFSEDRSWRAAMEVRGEADEPALCNGYREYQWDIQGQPETCSLRRRSVAMLSEVDVPVQRLTKTQWVQWHQPPEDYFDMIPPDAFTAVAAPLTSYQGQSATIPVKAGHAALLTFELAEQVVGWPKFVIDAPAGTIVEMLVHEAHDPNGPPIMNSHFHSWTRFICAEGENPLETFDFESLRWIQFHVRNYDRPVRIRQVGVRRRFLPWPKQRQVRVADARVQKVLEATVNTMVNSCQETIVDGMGRERQQYSGDVGHQLHALFATFGETQLPGRYVNTFSQGLTQEGYFLDTWPAWDRLARLAQRQLQLTPWGPLLDHGVQFVFDCWNYFLYTGRTEALGEPFPRLLTFFGYLQRLRAKDGLLPVENLGVPVVWMDNADAFTEQRQKQLAFNLYTAAMCEHALAPLCMELGQPGHAAAARRFGAELKAATIRRFWSASEGCFVSNLPWAAADGKKRYDDRSLATSVIFNQCPNGRTAAAVERLSKLPPNTGFSFPANAIWRYWALAKAGQTDVIVKELGGHWYEMPSVTENNTLGETWKLEKDSNSQWSHCPVAPLVIMHMGIAGIQPTKPGFTECLIRPQPSQLKGLDVVTHTKHGPIHVIAEGQKGDRSLIVRVPRGIRAHLVLPAADSVPGFSRRPSPHGNAYVIDGQAEVRARLSHT